MSHLIVLGNVVIPNLLLNLSREDILQFQKDLEDSLIAYNGGKERQYQPQPGVVNRPDGQKILFRPFTSPESVGTKIIVHPASDNPDHQLPLHGVLILCDSSGIPTGVLNAEEVTGFRTSLSALIPFMWRYCVSKIVVFGAGKQALWHCRLALVLRGEDISSITIVNRSKERARALVRRLHKEKQARWKSSCAFEVLDSSSKEDYQRLHQLLSTADVIFCTLPSTEPIFSLASLNLDGTRDTYPLITAVGSWQPNMIEVEPEILRYAVCRKYSDAPDPSPCAVLVDDAESCLTSCGEFVRSGLKRDQISEIGEILLRYRDKTMTDDIRDRFERNLVVYKSIGVSVTDLVAGNAIMGFAEKKGIGTPVYDF